MRHIYTSIDIGSDTIKIVVCELYHGRYNLLATCCVKSRGIKKGLITDITEAKACINAALKEIGAMLGFEIKKVIAIIPSYFADFVMIKGSLKIENDNINGNDVINVLQVAMKNAINVTKEMVTIIPIDFETDSGTTKDPLGQVSSNLSTRAIMVTSPKKNIYSVVGLLNSVGLDVVDISLGCIGDIYAFRTSEVDNDISCIINIGSEKTEVSLYNKGIIVKHNIVSMGSSKVDSDIAYMYKLDLETACRLKEQFALAHKNKASLNETVEVTNKIGEVIKINQYEISEIVASRIDEILNFAKEQLNTLTNRKPNFIFVTGGITNMLNFDEICREKLGNCAIIGNINLIGLRNNKFSSAIGNIIYFVNKLKLKGKDYSMISNDEMDILSSPRKNTTNDSMLGKVFGYFFGE
ncbi:MAG: cell division FtsA domain-containing protein [Bacilli bacterium]